MLSKLINGMFAKGDAVPAEAPPPSPSPAPAADAGLPPTPFPDAEQASVVLVSFGPTKSNPFANMAKMMQEAYARRGRRVYVLDMLADPFPAREIEGMFARRQVRYGVAWGGSGAHIELGGEGRARGIWEYTGTPVFKLIGDHPAYFIDAHVGDFPASVNVYGFAEHLDFFMRHLQTRGHGALVPLFQMDPLAPEELDFGAKQRGRIVFLKNGNSPEALRAAWQARLAPSVARILLDLSEELDAGLAGPARNIESAVSAHFAALGLDIAARTHLLAFYIAQMDDYLRRRKSTMIAEALLDLPIEVHGENWDHVRFEGRRAQLVPFGDYARSRQLISEALAVLDMAPNTQHQPHERFLRCASRHTLCLTDRSDYLQHNYAHLGQPMFDFTPDAIRGAVEDALGNPARAVQTGAAVGAEFKRRHGPDALIDFFEMTFDQLRLEQGPAPDVQPFLIWPAEKLDRAHKGTRRPADAP